MTNNIEVTKKKENETQLEFLVEVNSSMPDSDKTKHIVTVDKDYLENLNIDNSESSVENLIEKSFRFLLERESNQTILREFNLKIISSYFPEYESEIKSYL